MLLGHPDAVEHPRHRLRVAQRGRHDEGDERLLHGPGEPSDQAEVEEPDAVTRQDEEVAGVRVAVEEAVLEELAEGGLDDVLRHQLEVVARLGRDLGDLHAFQVLEREDGLRGEVRQHARDDHERAVLGGLGHGAGVPGLSAEVELLVNGAVELLHDSGRRVDPGLLDHRLDQPRQLVEERQVRLDALPDARPLHLHHHRFAGVGARSVYLSDGGRGERRLVQLGEAGLDRATQPALESRRAPRRAGRAAPRPAARRALRPSGRGGCRGGWRGAARA